MYRDKGYEAMACDLETEAADAEEMAQIGRLVTTSVPTFREKLRQFRDSQALHAGVEPPLVDEAVLALDRGLHDGLVSDSDDDSEAEPPTITTLPKRHKPERAHRGGGFKPGTRQAPPPAPTTSSARNWWETVKQGEQTKTAEQERPRMSGSKQAKRVTGLINE